MHFSNWFWVTCISLPKRIDWLSFISLVLQSLTSFYLPCSHLQLDPPAMDVFVEKFQWSDPTLAQGDRQVQRGSGVARRCLNLPDSPTPMAPTLRWDFSDDFTCHAEFRKHKWYLELLTTVVIVYVLYTVHPVHPCSSFDAVLEPAQMLFYLDVLAWWVDIWQLCMWMQLLVYLWWGKHHLKTVFLSNRTTTTDLVGGLVAIFCFPINIGCEYNPNWRTHTFQRGGEKPPSSDVFGWGGPLGMNIMNHPMLFTHRKPQLKALHVLR